MHMSPLLLSGVQCAQMSEQSQDHRSVGKVLTWNICHCSQTVVLRRTFTFAVWVAVRTTTWDKMCCNNSKKEFSYSVYQDHTYHVATNIGRKLNLADWWLCEHCATLKSANYRRMLLLGECTSILFSTNWQQSIPF